MNARSNRAYVALGANLGSAVQNIESALGQLKQWSLLPVRSSSFWESSPVDCPPGSPLFANAVAELCPDPNSSPEQLLESLLAVERAAGRSNRRELNSPRPLDLDLIAYGRETRNTARLILPHPRAHLRRFVLLPLAELNPDLVLPGQRLSVSELLADLKTNEALRRIRGPLPME